MERYKLNPLDYRPIAPDGASGQGPPPPNPRPGGGPPGGGPPGPGGPGLPPGPGDDKDTQTDDRGEDKDVQTEEQGQGPGATDEAFEEAEEGPIQRPAFLPGEEVITPALVGPHSASVPEPQTHRQGIDIFGSPHASDEGETVPAADRISDALAQRAAEAAAPQSSRMEAQLNATAPSQLASQLAVPPATHKMFGSESEPGGGS